MKKAEIIFSVLALLSIGIGLIPIKGMDIILILSVSILSTMYFYLGFALFNNIQFRKILKRDSFKNISTGKSIAGIIIGGALSILIIGLLFKLMTWKGSMPLIIAGWSALIISFALISLKYFSKEDPFYKGLLTRFVSYNIIALIIFLFPQYALLEIKYRKHPDYVNAVKAVQANPSDQFLYKQMKNERNRMNEREANGE